MPWTTIAELIVEVGYPMAQKIWALATTGTNATQADWDALNVMANQTASDRMKAQLVAAGIPETDPRYAQFMALAS